MDVVALLDPHFKDVTKSPCGQQSGPGASSLDQSIGHQGRPVHQVIDIGELKAFVRKNLSQSGQSAYRGVVWRGQTFVHCNLVGLGIGQYKISKGAANIKPQAVFSSSVSHD